MTTTTTQPDTLIVIFPQGDIGTARDARRLTSRRTGIPQARMRVVRPAEYLVAQEVTVHNLLPLADWTPDAQGWTPYVVARGIDLAE